MNDPRARRVDTSTMKTVVVCDREYTSIGALLTRVTNSWRGYAIGQMLDEDDARIVRGVLSALIETGHRDMVPRFIVAYPTEALHIKFSVNRFGRKCVYAYNQYGGSLLSMSDSVKVLFGKQVNREGW